MSSRKSIDTESPSVRAHSPSLVDRAAAFLTFASTLVFNLGVRASTARSLHTPISTTPIEGVWLYRLGAASQPLLDVTFTYPGEPHAHIQLLPLELAALIYSLNHNGVLSPRIRRTSGSFLLQSFMPTPSSSGPVFFQVDTTYLSNLLRLGLHASPRQMVELSLFNTHITDIQKVTSAFPDASFDLIVACQAFNRSSSEIVALKNALPTISCNDLGAFLTRSITLSYVRSLQSAGLQNLTAQDVIRLSTAGLSTKLVNSTTRAGHLTSVEQLLSSKRASSS